MSKIRSKPWICEGPDEPTGSRSEAKIDCPACSKIFCQGCFDAHRDRGCIIYTGTDQCLCIWEPPARYPACGHDMRGHEGAYGSASQ